jgi:enamine deaminase RidA (YjgF/YER057c/UK114 family)
MIELPISLCSRHICLDLIITGCSNQSMSSPEDRLRDLGITLPGMYSAIGTYRAAKREGNLVYVSGHGPLDLDRLSGDPGEAISFESGLGALIQGKVGSDIALEDARAAARTVGLFLLAALRAELGSLDHVTSIVKVFGMVNAAPGFTDTPSVIDGCSNLLVEVFGDAIGSHARTAIGVAELPLNIPVEIEMVVAVTF